MADELSRSGGITFSKGSAEVSTSYNDVVTVTGEDFNKATQLIGTADEVLLLGELSTALGATVIFKNLDGTNYIELGSNGTLYDIRINAGKVAGPFTWNGAAIHAKANTAACRLESTIIEA